MLYNLKKKFKNCIQFVISTNSKKACVFFFRTISEKPITCQRKLNTLGQSSVAYSLYICVDSSEPEHKNPIYMLLQQTNTPRCRHTHKYKRNPFLSANGIIRVLAKNPISLNALNLLHPAYFSPYIVSSVEPSSSG